MSDLTTTRVFYETRELCHRDVYQHLSVLQKSLLDLKLASKKALLDNSLYWQQELERIKLKKDKEWQERINLAEDENKQMRRLINNFRPAPTPSYDRELWEAENQIDRLNRQLDEKLIHINQLQIALAEQSKAIFELEKSYVLLYCQYRGSRQKENLKVKNAESKLEPGKAKLS